MTTRSPLGLLRGCTIFNLQRICRLFIVGLTPISAMAADMPAIELTLKPKVCVLSSEEETCFDELHIAWQSSEAMSICLYQKDHSTPLACWENANYGSHSMALNTGVSLGFMLREMEQNQLLASETFEVIHDHKQYRRARRNAWAFF